MLPNVNQITSRLAMMSDQQLQQYAALHKADPYVFPMAFAESNRRKDMRMAQQGQQGRGEQPKVADVALAGMAPQAPQQLQQLPQAPQALPEDSGIAQLPTGPMNFANGGIIAFQSGGSAKEGAALFDKALAAEGITDPRQIAFLKALHGQETSGGTNTRDSSRGAKGHMQVMPKTFKKVAPELDINKPMDNMRGGIRYGIEGYNAAKGDPVLAGAYYYGGPGGMAALAQGKARVNPQDKTGSEPNTLQYGQRIASRMTAFLPMGSAIAGQEQPPAQVAQVAQAANPASTGATSQIPTGGYSSAPASNAQPPGLFSRIGTDILGMSPDAQRNFSNLTQAVGGAFGAGYIPNMMVKGAGAAEQGIAALTPKATAEAAMAKATMPRLAAPTVAPTTVATGKAVVPFKVDPRVLQQTDDIAAAQKLLDAAQVAPKLEGAAQVAPKLGAAAQVVPKLGEVAQASQVARTVGNAARTARTIGQSTVADNLFLDDVNTLPAEVPPLAAPEITKKDEKAIIADTKKAVPEQKGKGWSGDDWLQLGLGLMAGESPYAMQNLGKAGLGVLASKQAQKKAQLEQTRDDAYAKYYGILGDQITSGEKLAQASETKVADYVTKGMAAWAKTVPGMVPDPGAEVKKRMELIIEGRKLFSNLEDSSTIAPTAPANNPAWGAPTIR